MKNLSSEYWSNRYKSDEIGWDLGVISQPIKEYIDKLTDKNSSILIPGCGSGYEGKYLFNQGFKNLVLLDFAKEPLEKFKIENPDFPEKQLINEDFFTYEGKYDLIIEQTLFCAIDPSLRLNYAEKISQLLKPEGKLIGLLFNREFESGPPFGGNKEEYLIYFSNLFTRIKMENCYNSVLPRKGSELFIQIQH
jgi:SAM-dependent methyltransferase